VNSPLLACDQLKRFALEKPLNGGSATEAFICIALVATETRTEDGLLTLRALQERMLTATGLFPAGNDAAPNKARQVLALIDCLIKNLPSSQ
jgi:hypothetical protein